MNLFGELFFAQFVKREKLARQNDVIKETTTGQFDTNDNLTIRYHHSNCPELNFQILW